MKRFYEEATIEGGALALDGKPARTKGGRAFAAPAPLLMEAVAEEWNAVGEKIDFAAMPMTRFAMTLVDLGESDAPKWRASILSFLKSDLVCYRAAAPAALRVRQADAWDPLLDWMASATGVRLRTGDGVAFIEQPAEALHAGDEAIAALSPAKLLGVKSAAEIAGSAVIAFALLQQAFEQERLFAASRVDEDFQNEQWGVDAEAQARARALRADFADAARFLTLVGEE